MSKQILLIDNYDSFTYNLLHYLQELGANVDVARNDQISVEDALGKKADGILISPGPATPDDSGICLDLIAKAAGRIPVLGVCLGHQAIAQVFGGNVIRTQKPMHGKTSDISHGGQGIFAGLKTPFTVTRYHSLIVERDTLPDCLEITSQTDDGIIMGLQHKEHALHGVQFHPESIASEHGHDLLRNFLALL
jgi:anthranilate synthase component 2